jgi:hypothetical protein
MLWMNCVFNVNQNLVAFYPQIKTTGLNEILCVFRNPGSMYYVHKNCLYDQAKKKYVIAIIIAQQMTNEVMLIELGFCCVR